MINEKAVRVFKTDGTDSVVQIPDDKWGNGGPSFEFIREQMGDPSVTLQLTGGVVRSPGREVTVFVDEDGLNKGLPPNLRASLIAEQPLVGTVVTWVGKYTS